MSLLIDSADWSALSLTKKSALELAVGLGPWRLIAYDAPRERGNRTLQALLASLGLESSMDYLRVVCGVFLLPHLIVKFQSQDFVKGFFDQAGLKPPIVWLYSAFCVEIVCSIGLIFNVYTRYAALLAGAFLLVASFASWRVSKGKWMWNFGGAEYPLFWAICCFVVAATY